MPPLRIQVQSGRTPHLFLPGEKPRIEVTVENRSPKDQRLEVRITACQLDGKPVQDVEVPFVVRPDQKATQTVDLDQCAAGLYRGVALATTGWSQAFWLGVLAEGESKDRLPRYDEIPPEVRKSLAIGAPRHSLQVNGPLGLYGHNELPMMEAVRVAADAGLGHVRFPQYPPLELTKALLEQGVDPVLHVTGTDADNEAMVREFQGKVHLYRFGGDEPNNRGTNPKDYVDSLGPISKMIRSIDPDALLMGADLGDEGTAAYWQRCLDAGILEHVNLNPYGYFLWGSEVWLYEEMERLRDYARRTCGKSYENFPSPLIMFWQPPSLMKANRMLRHMIEFTWRGCRWINLYKLIDHVEPFGLLNYEGSLSSPYVTLQNLCAVLDDSLKPVRDTDAVQSSGDLPQFVWRAFRNEDRMAVAFWRGQGSRCPLPNVPATPLDLVIRAEDHAYPVEVDLITGAVRALTAYRLAGRLLVLDVLARPHPKWLVLLRPKSEFAATTTPARPPSRLWRRLGMEDGLANDWVTAIIPQGDEVYYGTYNYGGVLGGGSPILSRYNRRSGQWTSWSIPHGAIDQTVSAVVAEPNDLWVGIRGAGLGRLDRRTGQWEILQVDDPGFRNNDLVSFSVTPWAVWCALPGAGVAVYDRYEKRWNTYSHLQLNELTGGEPFQAKEDAHRANRITDLLSTRDAIFAASMNYGITAFNAGKGAWELSDLPASSYWALCRTEDAIWAGGTGHLAKYDLKEKKWTVHPLTKGSPMDGQRVIALRPGADGRVYFATPYGGAGALDPAKGKIEGFLPGAGLSTGRVQGVHVDGNHVYFPTWGRGVSRYDVASRTWHTWSTEDGLADDRVWTVASDEDYVHFGTYRGASLLRKQPLMVQLGESDLVVGRSATLLLSFANLGEGAVDNLQCQFAPAGDTVQFVPVAGDRPAARALPGETVERRVQVTIAPNHSAREIRITAEASWDAGQERKTVRAQKTFTVFWPVDVAWHSPSPMITNVEAKSVIVRIVSRVAEKQTGTVSLQLPEGFHRDPDRVSFALDGAGAEMDACFSTRLKESATSPAPTLEAAAVVTLGGRETTPVRIPMRSQRLERWMMIGPFSLGQSAPTSSGEELLPPEKEVDFAASYQGREKGVAWRRIYRDASLTAFSVDQWMGVKKPEDERESIAYLATYLFSTSKEPLPVKPVIRVSTYETPARQRKPTCDVCIWLNRQRVLGGRIGKADSIENLSDLDAAKSGDGEGGSKLDEVPLETEDAPALKPGWNLLLIRAIKAQSPWGFDLELTDVKTGQPVRGLIYDPDRKAQ